jgi:hypothetical protein
VANCAPQQIFRQSLPAETRLKEIFQASRLEDLEALLANKVTVCLDQRLPGQNGGFFNTNAYATFYNQDPDHRVLALWDNGQSAQDPTFFDKKPIDYGKKAIRHLNGEEFNTLFGNPPAPFAMMAHFIRSCGKGCTTNDYQWRDVGEFTSGFKDVVKDHPELAQPPLKTNVSAPGLGS